MKNTFFHVKRTNISESGTKNLKFSTRN